MIDAKRPQFLNVSVVRRIGALREGVDHASVINAGEILILPKLPRHSLCNDGAVNAVCQSATVNTGRLECERSYLAMGDAIRVKCFPISADSAIYSDKLPELLDVRLMAMSPQGSR